MTYEEFKLDREEATMTQTEEIQKLRVENGKLRSELAGVKKDANRLFFQLREIQAERQNSLLFKLGVWPRRVWEWLG